MKRRYSLWTTPGSRVFYCRELDSELICRSEHVMDLLKIPHDAMYLTMVVSDKPLKGWSKIHFKHWQGCLFWHDGDDNNRGLFSAARREVINMGLPDTLSISVTVEKSFPVSEPK